MSESEPEPAVEALPPHRLSLVVPIHNEIDSVEPLVARIHEALHGYEHPWELVLVDDGSTDDTPDALARAAAERGSHVRVIQLQRNFGQTAAMQAGVDAARGDVISTLDGDLQNDPADIPAMVGRLLRENLDLVAGWRRERHDNITRTFPSRIANRLIGRITGVRLHDYGCSLKVYRTEVMRKVRLYGDMHRFIPAWMASATQPRRIGEHVVTHHARHHGATKYGLRRTYRVVLDLLSVFFFMRYWARPGHFFGAIGLLFGLVGGVCITYLVLLKLMTGADIGDRPLLLFGILFAITAVQLITAGVLAEMATRTYYEATQTRPYLVRESGSRNLDAEAGWYAGGATPVHSVPGETPSKPSVTS